MFGKAFTAYFISLFVILAAAIPGIAATGTVTGTPVPTATSISQCNTGDAQCCNTVGAANSMPAMGVILSLLNIVIQPVTAIVGLGCTPITVIGGGQGANCAQQPVCCSHNNFNGLINIGCTPISL